MKKKLVALFICVVILIPLVRVYRAYSPLDGVTGSLMASLPGFDDTVYATNYTDSGFGMIQIGMTRDQVYTIIGTPLDTWTNNDQSASERWSMSPHDSSFRLRVLIFSNESVSEKSAEYYFD